MSQPDLRVAALPTRDMAMDEGMRLARQEFPDWQFRWTEDRLSGAAVGVPLRRTSVYSICPLTMGATSSPGGTTA